VEIFLDCEIFRMDGYETSSAGCAAIQMAAGGQTRFVFVHG